jgi:hypothetical protein
MRSKELVIARCQEDLSWLDDRWSMPTKIYNKSPDHLPAAERHGEIISRPNVGREAESYLYHIIQNYHDLADVTFFVQGEPHCKDLQERVLDDYILPCSLTTHYREDWPKQSIRNLDMVDFIHGKEVRYGRVEWYGGRKPPLNLPWLSRVWKTFFQGPPPQPWFFGYGAHWAVPKEYITQRPLSFWRWCHQESLKDYHEMEPTSPWAFETIWLHLFSPQYYHVNSHLKA